MRALSVGTSTAAIVFVAACSLTDLGGLSGGAEPGDASIAQPPVEGGPLPDAAPPVDAPAEASRSDAYAATVLADGPVAYYRFEDATDSNAAKDELGAHPANETLAGLTFGRDGVAGHGALFDGKTALDIGDAFDFAGKVPFTLEVWVKTTTSAVGGLLFHKRDESMPSAFMGYVVYLGDTGEPHFEAWGGPTLSAWSNDPLPVGFAHVVLAVSYATGKGNATLYVNAQPAANGGYDNVADLPDTPQHFTIGRGFVGLLDEVAIYAKALPPDRILAHYRAGKP